MRALAVLGLCAAVIVADLATVIVRAGGRDRPSTPVAAAGTGSATEAHASTVPPTTAPPRPTTTAAPTTTTAAPTTTTAPPPPPGRPGAWTLGPYEGVGAWLDIYDWTAAMTGGHPKVEVQDIWHMADLGIQTIYIQTSYGTSPTDIAEPARLKALIDVAHARGMDVVGWYLPTLSDLTTDFRRIMASTLMPLDGMAIDIEDRSVGDPAARTAALLTLSSSVKAALGGRALGAITPSPVQIQVVNPRFWPGFPWPQLARIYDVMLPMSYWSDRIGEWHNGERLIGEDVDRIRASTGRPDMPVHVIGGIANLITLDDLVGMIHAVQARQILGASLYDWNTSAAAEWSLLQALHVR